MKEKLIDLMKKQEIVKKETMKTMFNQIQKNRKEAATDEAVFQELCWILTLQPGVINEIFDDFIPSSRYEMGQEEYEEIYEEEESKDDLPTLKEINERRREDMLGSIVGDILLKVPNVFVIEQ